MMMYRLSLTGFEIVKDLSNPSIREIFSNQVIGILASSALLWRVWSGKNTVISKVLMTS